MKKFIRIIVTALLSHAAVLCAAQESTLAIIKPDAVASNHIGDILARYEKAGLRIGAIRMVKLTEQEAKKFYAIHEGKPFFNELVKFMVSGPSVAVVLEGDNAVVRNRELMGSADKKGSLRAEYGTSLTFNAVHGSDSIDNAKQEVAFFFPQIDIQSR